MFFFNLTATEFFALFGALSSVVVMLYLLDRSRKKYLVPTLRFWQQTEIPSQRKHRRRIQQPWSLILQLLAITLLLLAIAQLRFGSPDRSSRDHVLLLDASAWMAAQTAPNRFLMDEARASALRYVRALPSVDRVMIVRTDALATPVTGFETNRVTLENAIRQTQASTSALNLGQGIDFANQALKLEGQKAGEIVFSGSSRMMQESLTDFPTVPPNFRLLAVKGEVENCGLRKLALRRSRNDPEVWEVYVTARNYGKRARTIPLLIAYGGAPMGTRRLTLAPGAEVSSTFEFRTKAAGWFEARLQSNDALPGDDTVSMELPAERALKVTIYSAQPELLRPLLQANRRVEAAFRKPNDYKPDPKTDIVIFDRVRPSTPVAENSLWIEPPVNGSPIPVRATKQDALLRWRADQSLAGGLRTRDARIENTEVFTASPNDISVAEVDGAPVILARPGKTKTAVFGFHPMRSALRFELATPLLFANLLKWMAPDIFLTVELQAGSVGTVTVPLEADYEPSQVRVVTDDSLALPFNIRNRTLRFFSGTPGLVRVSLGDRQLVYSLSLPQLGEARWEPPKDVRTGYAGVGGVESAARDVWQWLAILALILLIVEWVVFGRSTPFQNPAAVLPFLKSSDSPRRKAS